MQLHGLLLRSDVGNPVVSILCSHADCFRGKQHIKKSRKSFQPYTAHTGCVQDFSRGGQYHKFQSYAFNLMQPCRLRCIGFNFAITSAISILCSRVGYVTSTTLTFVQTLISILCSRVGYVGNSAQRLHFLHNIALCILLSFGAVMVVCC